MSGVVSFAKESAWLFLLFASDLLKLDGFLPVSSLVPAVLWSDPLARKIQSTHYSLEMKV